MIRGTSLKRKKPMRASAATLKRSGFKRPAPGVYSSFKSAAKRLKPGRSTGKPTAAEQRWMDFVAGFGCVVCWVFLRLKVKCEVHHILEVGRRRGHLFTIGLCRNGHHKHDSTSGKIPRHPYKKRFEAAYGTEYELLAFLQTQYKQPEKL